MINLFLHDILHFTRVVNYVTYSYMYTNVDGESVLRSHDHCFYSRTADGTQKERKKDAGNNNKNTNKIWPLVNNV